MTETTFVPKWVMRAICEKCQTELCMQDLHTGCPNCGNRLYFQVTYIPKEEIDEPTARNSLLQNEHGK